MPISMLSIVELYRDKGHLHYEGEGVSQLAHAWQCGQLAIKDASSPKLQLAAWLHDIGHLLSKKDGTPTSYGHDDHHERLGGNYLAQVFSEEVAQPVLMHVLAKRFLITTNPEYHKSLSPDSIRSLILQGGEMTVEDCEKFLSHSFASDAILLRRWDELAKNSELVMPNKDEVITELANLIEVCL